MTINKKISLALGIIVIVVAGGTAIIQNMPSKQNSQIASVTTNQVTTNATTTTSTVAPDTYTLADIATHNNSSSCWTAINGSVYDVTTWINQHPGGQQAILSLCGTDGSAAFNGQHGGQSRPASELATFKIGTLVQ